MHGKKWDKYDDIIAKKKHNDGREFPELGLEVNPVRIEASWVANLDPPEEFCLEIRIHGKRIGCVWFRPEETPKDLMGRSFDIMANDTETFNNIYPAEKIFEEVLSTTKVWEVLEE